MLNEAEGDRHSSQTHLVATLDGWSICLRIGVGDSELDDVRATSLNGKHDIDGIILAWEPGGDKRHEGGLVLYDKR